MLTIVTNAHSQENVCAPVAIPGHYGPYDYVTEGGKLIIVEQFHFGPEVEALIRGKSGSVAGDLSYTLNASPNHHRALAAIVRLGERTKSPQPPGLKFSIDCYFDRAVRFRPNDTVVRTIFAFHLSLAGRRDEALYHLAIASEAAADDPAAHARIGLLYFHLKQHREALKAAHRARNLGLPNSVLEDQLRTAGQWKDPSE
jgi:tetratricopeptide (TPR) repeat protein